MSERCVFLFEWSVFVFEWCFNFFLFERHHHPDPIVYLIIEFEFWRLSFECMLSVIRVRFQLFSCYSSLRYFAQFCGLLHRQEYVSDYFF